MVKNNSTKEDKPAFFKPEVIPAYLQSLVKLIYLLLRSKFNSFKLHRTVQVPMTWWEKPGISVMYQIEFRPGWEWDRDYAKFNASMAGSDGKLKFDGPRCRIEDWVNLSKEIGLDYHILEIKWHDGICYFNTRLTEWKTEIDYTGLFADLSRKYKIPFMFYYSSIFDHNPQFDGIQPDPRHTPSFLGLAKAPQYLDYLTRHYDEIIEQYKPDGMWFDWFWYWPEKTTIITLEHMQKHYPDVAITFNFTNCNPNSYNKKLHYTCGETHKDDGPLLVKQGDLTIFTSCWKWSNMNRSLRNQPWENISPAGKWWQDPTLRDDPNEVLRMAAITLACGGKLCLGATSQMNGEIFPDQVRQLKILGQWYIPRKSIFAESVALRYGGEKPKGVQVNKENFNCVAGQSRDGVLLHIINMQSSNDALEITLDGKPWIGFTNAYLEPEHREIVILRERDRLQINIKREDVDTVDTILRFTKGKTI
jgi:alpha-L-fucosidase